MNRVILYQDDCSGTTSVSNLFIDSFMKDANDAQLKIYLYLIRTMSCGQPISISDMADKFNHTEKDVIRSLQYWERNRLISLDYDEMQNIIGIHLHTPASAIQEQPKSLAPIVTLVPPIVQTVEKNISFAPDKPSYTADQLRAFKEDEDVQLMLCVIEQYLGKPLNPTDIKTLLYIQQELHFSSDLIDTLLQYCVEQGKKELRYIEKVAIGWYEQGITNTKQALANVGKYNKNIYSVMKALGKTNTPTAKEVDFINRWTAAFSIDVILESCSRTVMATDSHRFEYTDGILSNWKKMNVCTLADIKNLELSFKKAKTNSSDKNSTDNKFNHFAKTNYDFDALERDILSN